MRERNCKNNKAIIKQKKILKIFTHIFRAKKSLGNENTTDRIGWVNEWDAWVREFTRNAHQCNMIFSGATFKTTSLLKLFSKCCCHMAYTFQCLHRSSYGSVRKIIKLSNMGLFIDGFTIRRWSEIRSSHT